MMTGFLRQWDEEKRYFPKAFATAMDFLRGKDLSALEAGKHPIDGDRIFASVQEVRTEPMRDRRFELHRDYIDIQVLHTGRELHGYTSLPPVHKALEDKLDTADVAFYRIPSQAEGLQTIILQPGQYVVYLPGELHCPCCAVEKPENIFKTVLKIHKSCVD